VQILEHHKQRLDLTLPQEQLLERLKGPSTALCTVEGVPHGILDRHVQQRQERWRETRLQGPIQH
jgi:hypothetical protein